MPEELSETAPNAAPAKSLLEVTFAGVIALAKDSGNYDQANEQFEAILSQIEADNPTATPLLKLLWKEFINSRRAATFWETVSDAEKDLSDKMTASTIQLKQNYMRLMQEQ